MTTNGTSTSPPPVLSTVGHVFHDRTVVVLTGLILLGTGLVVWHVHRLQTNLVETFGLQDAARYSQALKAFRTLYTSEVVGTVQRHGIEVTHDYKTKDNAIPLPATLSMMLGNRIAENGSGGMTKLYSAYPFPWRRETGGLQDAFAEEAWNTLTKNPETPFYRFEVIDGTPSLRFATADRMRPDCVHCHNTHPDTPKSDWNVGDVRGVLEVITPLDVPIAQSRANLRGTVALMIVLAFLAIGALVVVIRRLKRTAAELEERIEERTAELKEANASLEGEIAERIEAEEKLKVLSQEMVKASRLAGMAEIATGVLHNVGNVLNSVNVSATVVSDKLRKSKVSGLAKAAGLMHEHEHDLEAFLTQDEKGQNLPGYLTRLAEHLTEEQGAMIGELDSLTKNIEHIKQIVSTQQSHAGGHGIVETVSIADVVDDALTVDAASFKRHGIERVREYADLPPIALDKHRLLQIMVNLVRNAEHAVRDGDGEARRLTLRIGRNGESRVRIEVTDTGVGIAKENLTRIFSHGFTTKKDGHGFGLHSAALAAKEMGGSLSVHSDGPGKGATFVLDLPFEPAEVMA